jgi:hypothetical protein
MRMKTAQKPANKVLKKAYFVDAPFVFKIDKILFQTKRRIK